MSHHTMLILVMLGCGAVLFFGRALLQMAIFALSFALTRRRLRARRR